jgi:hypothetical protein
MTRSGRRHGVASAASTSPNKRKGKDEEGGARKKKQEKEAATTATTCAEEAEEQEAGGTTTKTREGEVENTETNNDDGNNNSGKGVVEEALVRAGSIGLGRLPSFDLEKLIGHMTHEPLGESESAGLLTSLPSLNTNTSLGGMALGIPASASPGKGGVGVGSSLSKTVTFDLGDLTPIPTSDDLFMDTIQEEQKTRSRREAATHADDAQGKAKGTGVLRAPSLDLNTLSRMESLTRADSGTGFRGLASLPRLESLAKGVGLSGLLSGAAASTGEGGGGGIDSQFSLPRLESLQRVGSLTRMGSLSLLQKAKSGEFLEFLQEMAEMQDQGGLGEGDNENDNDNDNDKLNEFESSLPPTPSPPPTPSTKTAANNNNNKTSAVAAAAEKAKALLESAPPESENLMEENESLFREAIETTKTNNVKLRNYFLSEERAGDILYFSKDRTPCLEEVRIRRDGRDGKNKQNNTTSTSNQQESHRKVTRMSDKQEKCICSLRPQLMFPEGAKGWKYLEMQGPTCTTIRNTSAAKKGLENYKYTGFCKDHVEGKGPGSREAWLKHKKCTVRGFNLERNVNDRRMRHLLCLESDDGLVFLKWCTQCHLWKNFSTFVKRDKADKEMVVHTFCSICHVRQVLSRDKRRLERAKKRKAAEMEKSADKDKDLEEIEQKLRFKRQNTMETAWIKSFALESTSSKFAKFSKTIFENIEEKPIMCGVFSGTAEDIIVIKAMEILLELQTNPLKSPQVFGEGRWIQVVQELLENDLEPALAQYNDSHHHSGGVEANPLQRQTSLDFWAKPNKKELVKRQIQDLLQVDEVRYKIILLGSLLVESRLSALLEREVRLEAMYEGCILLAFTCDLLPSEEEHKLLQLNPTQMFGLHKMGWSGLHYKCGGNLMALVEGPHMSEDLVDIVEMLGVKPPPHQILDKDANMLSMLYPSTHIQVVQMQVQQLTDQATKWKSNSNTVGHNVNALTNESSPFEQVDWQGCTPLHHAVLHTTMAENRVLGTLLVHGVDCMKENRRGFSPLEVAALSNPQVLPLLIKDYLTVKVESLGGGGGENNNNKNDRQKKKEEEEERRRKVMFKLRKTLESSSQNVNHDLTKRNALLSIKILHDIGFS